MIRSKEDFKKKYEGYITFVGDSLAESEEVNMLAITNIGEGKLEQAKELLNDWNNAIRSERLNK